MKADDIREHCDTALSGHHKKALTAKPLIWAAIAGASLLSVYFIILALANSPGHVFEEFYYVWYWIVPLTIGFSTQAGLFAYIRYASKILSGGTATSSMAVSGGVSTTSMVACCAHHVTDIVPFLGATAAAVFFARFQSTFMVVGIFSNIIGIFVMLRIIKNGALTHAGQRLLPVVTKLNLNRAIIASVIAGVISTGVSAYLSM